MKSNNQCGIDISFFPSGLKNVQVLMRVFNGCLQSSYDIINLTVNVYALMKINLGRGNVDTV